MRLWLERLLLAASALILLLCLAFVAGLFDAPPTATPLRPALAHQPHEPLRGDIDINHADDATLQSLPGIGPHLARLIIQHRERSPFYYVEDLKVIPGIGDKRVEGLRPLLRFD